MASSESKRLLTLLLFPTVISLLITVSATAAFYFYELENRKLLRRTALEQTAITLAERLDQSFTDVNFALIDSAHQSIDCNRTQLRFSRLMLLELPQVSELRFTDANNKILCNSWQRFRPPLRMEIPLYHKGLNFSGPQLLDEYNRPGFQLYRRHQDGGKVQAVLHSAWLKNQVKFFHSQLGYMAIIDSDSGVPVVINGSYALPVGLTDIEFPVNYPQGHEGQLDNNRSHYTYVHPLLTQPELSVIISQDLDTLYQGIFTFSTSWGGTAAGAFALILLLSYRLQRHLIDPIRQIRSAIQRDEFFNLYQPLVCSSSGQIVGCEVLMRWQHPFKGLLPPMVFIPLAEQSGLIKEMTVRQLDQAIRNLQPVLVLQPDLKVSVNICASHLVDDLIVEAIIQRAAQLPGLVLEITEHQVVEHSSSQIQSALSRIRASNIKIAMDDFGTGYCGLTYLSTLPIDILKADRSFVAALGTDSINADVLRTIYDLTRKLNMSAIAEGVEKQEQADMLREIGFDIQQGWLHGHPMQAHDFYLCCRKQWQEPDSRPSPEEFEMFTPA